jgi:hypothetical protein
LFFEKNAIFSQKIVIITSTPWSHCPSGPTQSFWKFTSGANHSALTDDLAIAAEATRDDDLWWRRMPRCLQLKQSAT